MKLLELHSVFDPKNADHKAAANDLDIFTSVPRADLKPQTIELLKRLQKHQPLRLYRVLFSDDFEELADKLKVSELKEGGMVSHEATRVTSWTPSLGVTQNLADENEDLTGSVGGAVILMADIPASNIVIDFTKLSVEDKSFIKDGSSHLIQLLDEQREVIVDAGKYSAKIVKIITY